MNRIFDYQSIKDTEQYKTAEQQECKSDIVVFKFIDLLVMRSYYNSDIGIRGQPQILDL